MLHSADILKLNEHELPLIAGWFGATEGDETQVRFLQDRFSIDTLIVTRGGDGAIVLSNDTLYRHPGYPVTVADTVGSGDAFLAGFLAKTNEGKPIPERLQFANALGAFIASKEGACPVYRVEDVASFFPKGNP